MASPKVSIIIPIYKVEKYIEKCVRSLFEQTLDDLEYIFIDDCSPDQSVDILLAVLDEYPYRKEQVMIVHHQENKGLTYARNTGLGLARGEYIAHCDSDDWVAASMYEEMYNAALNQTADAVFCDICIIEDDKVEIFKSLSCKSDNIEALNNYILLPWNCAVNILVKRSIYDEFGICAPTMISYCEDFHLTVRLLFFAKKITVVPKAFYFYNRMNQTSITHQKSSRAIEDKGWCYLDIIRFFKEHSVLHLYEKNLSIRVLNYKANWVFDKDKWEDYRQYYPESHKYLKYQKGISIGHRMLILSVLYRLKLLSNILIISYKTKRLILNCIYR